ncbi:hypothetical protein HELRODRAFT_161093 [Helobdella robusta]|uniref:Uncharacterized protein n=1 Tax=Helobdella robusta TaxID=6412 RepID=T1ER35_HELRO|nr:hypothetical protein HELRODRAFT_161093 [Helobdella robusta]ESO01900.1 hypothetical protein HELRODRAFT_161093 [Helobdella robusta]
MSAHKSLGSLETFSPDDNSYSKHILTAGVGDSTPNDGSTCLVLLTVLDNNNIPEEKLGGYALDKETEITIGEGDTVISELLDKILITMKEGEQCYVKSNIDVSGQKVQKYELDDNNFKFKLTLKTFNRAAEMSELLADEKLERAEHHKNQGTLIFNNNLKFSFLRFKKSLRYLDDIEIKHLTSSQFKQAKLLKLQCHLNLAAAYLKEQAYSEVVSHCNEAFNLDATNVKGLYRRAQAYLALHEYNMAKLDLIVALKHEPENKALTNLIKTVDLNIKKEKQLYQKMFS